MSPSVSFAYAATGAFWGIYGIASVWRAVAARRWNVVTGAIIESRLKGGYTGSTFRWDAIVRYRYEMGGTQYEAERVSYGSLAVLGWRRIAERVHAKYPLGKRVNVHVCPTNPALAVLEAGPSTFMYSYIVIGAGLFAIGLHGMFWTP